MQNGAFLRGCVVWKLETPRMESDVTVKESVKDDPEETVS